MQEEKICTCWYHKDGSLVKHIMPCCNLTYKKYINKDFTIDTERYETLKKALKK